MAAKQWHIVRLTHDTVDTLDAIGAILERSHEAGKRTIPFGTKGEIPLNYIVQVIADHFLDHNQRSRKPCSDTSAIAKEPPDAISSPEPARPARGKQDSMRLG